MAVVIPLAPDPMPASLARFPIRCGWAPPTHDAPAVVVLIIARPCGCPDPKVGEAYTCDRCFDSHPVGRAGQPSLCSICGAMNPATITGSRPLNEGDLP